MSIKKIIIICLLVATVIFAVLATLVNGGTIFALVGAATFIAFMSLIIFKTHPVIATSCILLMYVMTLAEVLFNGRAIYSIVADLLIVGSATMIYAKKNKSNQAEK